MSNDGSSSGEPVGARGRELVAWCAGVAVLAVLVLLVHAPLFQPGRLHVQDMYVDQAGYITTARVLVDTGELREGVLFPAYLETPDVHMHMPGHVLALALSYLLFGWGVLQSLLPSLAGYVLAAAGTFLIGNRLYGRPAGLLAALLFLLFPANVTYAFTAMAELTFTCSCVAALALFVLLPARWQAPATPLLLVLPFLFRESGAFLVIPMAALVLRARGLAAAAGAAAASVVTLYLVNLWQVASGKVEASLVWVTDGHFNYANALDEEEAPLTSSEFLGKLLENAGRNLELLKGRLDDFPGELLPWCLFVLLAACAVLLWLGLRRVRRDPFPIAAGLLMALVFLLSIFLYDVKAHKFVRSAIYTFPFAAIALAGIVDPAALRERLRAIEPRSRQRRLAALVALGLACVVGSVAVSRLAGRVLCSGDARTLANTNRLVAMHDPGQVLIGSNAVAQYAVEHYPVRWSLPTAGATLDLMLERMDVGTIVLDKDLNEYTVRKHNLALVFSQQTPRAKRFYKTVEGLRRMPTR